MLASVPFCDRVGSGHGRERRGVEKKSEHLLKQVRSKGEWD
jgi:hypothetical protein